MSSNRISIEGWESRPAYRSTDPKWENRKYGGFTLLELMLLICIIGVLTVTVTERFLYYRERAEKTMMDATLAAIKMGLQIRLAELIIANRQGNASELERENPMRWLDQKPANYAGAYSTSAKGGGWYFAADVRQLVYVPNSSSYLQTARPAARELRFKVGLRYDQIEGGGGKSRAPSGVAILPVDSYHWF
jgi:type II secretory pathway pseudopilin PulG